MHFNHILLILFILGTIFPSISASRRIVCCRKCMCPEETNLFLIEDELVTPPIKLPTEKELMSGLEDLWTKFRENQSKNQDLFKFDIVKL